MTLVVYCTSTTLNRYRGGPNDCAGDISRVAGTKAERPPVLRTRAELCIICEPWHCHINYVLLASARTLFVTRAFLPFAHILYGPEYANYSAHLSVERLHPLQRATTTTVNKERYSRSAWAHGQKGGAQQHVNVRVCVYCAAFTRALPSVDHGV